MYKKQDTNNLENAIVENLVEYPQTKIQRACRTDVGPGPFLSSIPETIKEISFKCVLIETKSLLMPIRRVTNETVVSLKTSQ